jgi:hypothetical protein
MIRFAIVASCITACAHSEAPPRKGRVEFAVLTPTANGVALTNQVERPSLDGVSAGVSWHSASRPGHDLVLFVRDRVICIRERVPLGIKLSEDQWDAEPDVVNELVRLDFKSAEIDALERDIEPGRARPWIIITTARRDAERAKRSGAHLAERLFAAGVADDVVIALVAGLKDRIELRLVSPGGERAITDALEATTSAPRGDAFESAFNIVFEGPETPDRDVTDSVAIRAWRGDDIRSWSSFRDGTTIRDARWMEAVRVLSNAVQNGCVFE